MKVGTLIIGTEVDDKGFNDGMKQIKATGEKEKIDIDVDVDDTKMEVIKTKSAGVLGKLKTFGAGLTKVLSSALIGLLKVITTIGLAFAGIMAASAGVFILIKAIQKVKDSKDFQQIKTDIQYIIYALGQILKPVIGAVSNFIIKVLKGIVNIIKTIIFYIAYLIKAWTGYDMFKNLDTSKFKDDMAKSSKSAKDTAKAAKEINKQLAGFDEMNILQDTNAGGSGAAAGGGIGDPGFKMEDDWLKWDPPKWLVWLGKNGGKVISILSGIAAALIAVKAGAEPLMGLGIGILIMSIVQFIQDLIDMIKDPSLGKFADLLRDVSGILLGISIILIAINASNPAGWIVLLVAGLAALVSAILKHWDKIKDLGKKIWEGIKELGNKIWEFLKGIGKAAYEAVTTPFKDLAKFFYDTFKAAWDKVSKLFSKGGKIFSGIKDGIVDSFKAIVNAIITGINKVIAVPFKTINGLLNKIRNISILGGHPFKGLWDKNPLPVPQIPKLAKGGIINLPGRGVPVGYGAAIAGESGREAVLPLTDTQMMAQLGEEIGKHINVAATIPIYVSNRMIERQQKKITIQNDFAANRS